MDVQAQFPETRREDCRRMSSADLRQKRWRGQSRLFLPRRPRPAKCFPASGLDGRCCAERMILLRKCFCLLELTSLCFAQALVPT